MAGDGGVVFPGAVAISPAGDVYHGFSGISLRDHIAISILPTVIATSFDSMVRNGLKREAIEKAACGQAYSLADAMLAARETKP